MHTRPISSCLPRRRARARARARAAAVQPGRLAARAGSMAPRARPCFSSGQPARASYGRVASRAPVISSITAARPEYLSSQVLLPASPRARALPHRTLLTTPTTPGGPPTRTAPRAAWRSVLSGRRAPVLLPRACDRTGTPAPKPQAAQAPRLRPQASAFSLQEDGPARARVCPLRLDFDAGSRPGRLGERGQLRLQAARAATGPLGACAPLVPLAAGRIVDVRGCPLYVLRIPP